MPKRFDMGKIDLFRTGKVYTSTEAAKLTRTSSANVRRWLLGYQDTTGKMRPVFGEKDKGVGPLEVSFLELAEIIVVLGFRQRGVLLKELRGAHRRLSERLEVEYPFASTTLAEQGGKVLAEYESELGHEPRLAIPNMSDQFVLPGVVQARLMLFDFHNEDGLAIRWFPYGKDVPIVVDPEFGGGKPTVQGRGLTTDIIVRRHDFGESVDSIADDFQLERSKVEIVLQYAA